MICPHCSRWIEPVPALLRLRGYDRVIWPLRKARAEQVQRVIEDAMKHHNGACLTEKKMGIKHQRDKEMS